MCKNVRFNPQIPPYSYRVFIIHIFLPVLWSNSRRSRLTCVVKKIVSRSGLDIEQDRLLSERLIARLITTYCVLRRRTSSINERPDMSPSVSSQPPSSSVLQRDVDEICCAVPRNIVGCWWEDGYTDTDAMVIHYYRAAGCSCRNCIRIYAAAVQHTT